VVNRNQHSSLVGMSLDYRVRMLLDASFDPATTVAMQGLGFLERVADVVDNGEHRLRILREGFDLACEFVIGVDTAAVDLDRAAVLLSWCEYLYRASHYFLESDAGRMLDACNGGEDLAQEIDPLVLEDLATLRSVGSVEVAMWRAQIADGDVYVMNPVLTGRELVGGADADWLIGSTLVECKAISSPTSSTIREALLQLLGYTLLDMHDDLHIRSVALWLPRHGAIGTWSLDELMGQYTSMALPDLRSGLEALF